MTTQKYFGTCQCGRVRYEAELEIGAERAELLGRGTHRTALIKPSAFRLLSGALDLEDTQFGMVLSHNQACRHCGIRPFGKARLAKLGDVYAINLSTLDLLASQAAGATH
jgi:hypothetical protein